MLLSPSAVSIVVGSGLVSGTWVANPIPKIVESCSMQPDIPSKRDGPGIVGMFWIHNNCKFAIVVETVNQFQSDGAQPIIAGSKYSAALEDYGEFGRGGELEAECRPNVPSNVGSGVAQLEYTVAQVLGQTYFDMSFVNGNPFLGYDQRMETSDPNAPRLLCAGGDEHCGDAYLTPTDNWADKAAVIGSDLHYWVC